MARLSLALAATMSVLSMLAGPGVPTALATHSHARRAARCATAHRARALPRRGVRSFRSTRCPSHRGGSQGGSHASRGPGPAVVLHASDGVCPDATITPQAGNVELVRAATLCLINRERSDRGEQPLRWNARLVQAAQEHTESMAWGDYFEHIGPAGDTPLSRMRRSGYIYSPQIGYAVGENIGLGTLWLGTPRAIVAAWMASPGHRANILDPRFRDTGIGVSPHPPAALADGQPGGIYTQDFGVIIGG